MFPLPDFTAAAAHCAGDIPAERPLLYPPTGGVSVAHKKFTTHRAGRVKLMLYVVECSHQ